MNSRIAFIFINDQYKLLLILVLLLLIMELKKKKKELSRVDFHVINFVIF